MIIESILEYDLHKSGGKSRHPLILEIPAKIEFLPAVVSSSRSNKFIVTNSITKDNRIRTGIFRYDNENLDVFLKPMFDAALECSRSFGFQNIFSDLKSACKYIAEKSGIASQPHVILIPSSYSTEKRVSILGEADESKKYGISKIVVADVSNVVVLSRPDFVGLLTRFDTGVSLLLHNINLGIAFVI